MKFNNFHLLLVSCLLLLVTSQSAYAAEFKIEGPAEVSAGMEFRVDVVVLPEGKEINALEGVLVAAPPLQIQGIVDGGSIVALWIEQPAVVESGQVRFSGIVPAGFGGKRGFVLSLVLKGAAAGAGEVRFQSGRVLANDGKGTELPLAVSAHTLKILHSTSTAPTPSALKDSIPPSAFVPRVLKDPDVFEGKYFAVFSTTDKESGVDHYEVAEVPSGAGTGTLAWKRADSPHVLTDQALSSDIYVRAVDRGGNFVMAVVPAQHPSPRAVPGELPALSGIMIVLGIGLIALVYVIAKMRRRQRT